MLNVTFTYIDKDEWMGGYNYLLNLFSALEILPGSDIHPMLFVGEDVDPNAIRPFEMHSNVTVMRNKLFNRGWKKRLLSKSVIFGKHRDFEYLFRECGIGLIFENACFFGWNFKIPTIAWMPDFQHRHLQNMFGFLAYWKREIGFRVQIFSKRAILLSSEDAKKDFESFYSIDRGKIFVVPFAVEISSKVLRINPITVRSKYNLPEEFYFLPNQFYKHKNHGLVVEALRILKDCGKNPVVAVSGNVMDAQASELVKRLKEKVRAFHLEKNFLFLGSIPYEDVIGLMRTSRALVNPSLFEGWSTSVEEVKSLGIPMILSDLSVHKEQAEEQAIFFDRNSSNSLAEAFLICSKLDSEGRHLSESMAISDARVRRINFAKKFTDVLLHCAKSR